MSEKAVKKNGWKDIQSKKKLQKKTKLALIVLGIAILLIIFGQLFRFTKSLFSPWEDSANIQRSYIWNGDFNINLLIRASTISLLSYNPIEGKLTIIDVPDKIYLQLPHDFGKWQIRAVYKLGGDKLLTETLTSFFAIPVDGFLDFGSATSNRSATEVVDRLRQSPISGLNLLTNLKSNLTLWELIRLKVSISSLRFDKIRKINLEKLGILDEEKLADGTSVFTSDPVKLDSVLSDFAESNILKEHLSIAVFNATAKSQLAQKWTRLITNIGGNVIITSNSDKKIKNTQVIGAASKTVTRLSEIFNLGCSNNPNCDRIDPKDDYLASRAQVDLFLGEDYFNR